MTARPVSWRNRNRRCLNVHIVNTVSINRKVYNNRLRLSNLCISCALASSSMSVAAPVHDLNNNTIEITNWYSRVMAGAAIFPYCVTRYVTDTSRRLTTQTQVSSDKYWLGTPITVTVKLLNWTTLGASGGRRRNLPIDKVINSFHFLSRHAPPPRGK